MQRPIAQTLLSCFFATAANRSSRTWMLSSVGLAAEKPSGWRPARFRSTIYSNPPAPLLNCGGSAAVGQLGHAFKGWRSVQACEVASGVRAAARRMDQEPAVRAGIAGLNALARASSSSSSSGRDAFTPSDLDWRSEARKLPYLSPVCAAVVTGRE